MKIYLFNSKNYLIIHNHSFDSKSLEKDLSTFFVKIKKYKKGRICTSEKHLYFKSTTVQSVLLFILFNNFSIKNLEILISLMT